MFSDDVATIPIPPIESKERGRLRRFAELATSNARKRLDLHSAVTHRILDLAPPERKKLSRKLEDWWTLDFAQFRDEVKRAFRAEIPVKERADWETYLATNAAEVKKLDAEIEKSEREIDTIVYRLFDLTAEEIKLLEDSIAGQY
jgi:hypothetical protein